MDTSNPTISSLRQRMEEDVRMRKLERTDSGHISSGPLKSLAHGMTLALCTSARSENRGLPQDGAKTAGNPRNP